MGRWFNFHQSLVYGSLFNLYQSLVYSGGLTDTKPFIPIPVIRKIQKSGYFWKYMWYSTGIYTGTLARILNRLITVRLTLLYKYSKTSLPDRLHRSTTPLYRSLYFGPKPSPIQIFWFSKPTTSLNGPPKFGRMVIRFTEVLLYINLYLLKTVSLFTFQFILYFE